MDLLVPTPVSPSPPQSTPAPSLDLALPGETSPVGLALPDSLAFDDWQEIGARLCALRQSVGFWIGDWWAFGEHRYGGRSELVATGLFGRSVGSLRNAGSVARAIATSRRRDVLSFGHHAAVAAVPPQQADALLDRAQQEHLSVRALRRLVRAARGVPESGAESPDAPSPADSAPPTEPSAPPPPADPLDAVIDALRPAVARHAADHGRQVAMQALTYLRHELQFGRALPPPRRLAEQFAALHAAVALHAEPAPARAQATAT